MSRIASSAARASSAPVRDLHAEVPWPRVAVGLALALTLLGVATRLRLYLTNRSLWLDEVFVALNLMRRSFMGLMQPLDYNQAAPPGFLWIEKAIVTLFGTSEYALRLWPLVLGLASVPLFSLLARRTLAPVAGCVAILLFATSPPLNYFASDAKQYGGDAVFVTLVVLLVVAYRARRDLGTLAVLAATGVVAPWLSHPALFALAAGGLVLAADSIGAGRMREAAMLAVIGAAWAASVAVAYKLSLGALAADSSLQDYWNDSFAPLPWSDGALERARTLVLGWFSGNPVPAYELPGLTLALTALGAALLAGRDRRLLALIGGPIALAVVASMAHVYPVRARLMVFAAPLFVMLLAVGVEGVYSALKTELPRLGTVAVALAAVVVISWSWPVLRYGWFREETRDAFAYVQAHVEPQDVVFLDHWASESYEYYRPRFDFRGARTHGGAEYEGDWDARRADLAPLAGARRAWIVFSHPSATAEEQKVALHILGEMGREVGEKFERPGVAVYLFDLS